MSTQLALYDGPTGPLVADFSHKAEGTEFSTNNRGFAEAKTTIPLGLAQTFGLYDWAGLLWLRMTDQAGLVYEGRCEDIGIVPGGIELGALGASRALADMPYTAVWSDQSLANVTEGLGGGSLDETYRFTTQINDMLYCTVTKNAGIDNLSAGGFRYRAPDGSSRAIAGISFDLRMAAPATLTFYVQTLQQDGTFIANDIALVGTGAFAAQSYHILLGANVAQIRFMLYNGSGGLVLPAGETGANFFLIANLRIVSTTTNRVNTALTANVLAGNNRTITVGSTARMYVGQRLVLNGGTAASESVVVESIPTSTTFVADIFLNHTIGEACQGWIVYASEIAADLAATAAALNGQLSSATTLIQTPGVDLVQQVFEDQYPADILDTLAGYGGLGGTIWEWGIYASRMLYFRQQAAQATWYVDVGDVQIRRTIDELANSVYATYDDASGRALRTPIAASSVSVQRYGLTRRIQINSRSTDATDAATQRDAALADQSQPLPRSAIEVAWVYDASGARYPGYVVRAGDTCIIRNLPPTLSTTINRIQSFRVSRTTYSVDDAQVRIEPELPLPSLEALLARMAIAIGPSVGSALIGI